MLQALPCYSSHTNVSNQKNHSTGKPNFACITESNHCFNMGRYSLIALPMKHHYSELRELVVAHDLFGGFVLDPTLTQ